MVAKLTPPQVNSPKTNDSPPTQVNRTKNYHPRVLHWRQAFALTYVKDMETPEVISPEPYLLSSRTGFQS